VRFRERLEKEVNEGMNPSRIAARSDTGMRIPIKRIKPYRIKKYQEDIRKIKKMLNRDSDLDVKRKK